MELLAAALIVIGFAAIIVRFVTRDASGQLRLPRVVDESIGMWALRRATGRSLGARVDDEDADVAADGQTRGRPTSRPVPESWRLYPPATSGAARPAPSPSIPSSSPRPLQPLVRPSLEGSIGRPAVAPAPRTRSSGIRAWPWPSLTGPFAAALMISILALGSSALPTTFESGVEGLVGTPAPTPPTASGAVVVPADASPSPAAPAGTTAKPAPPGATTAPRVAGTAHPTTTPRPTPRPTPKPTARPTATPAATPTPPPPPVASITCVLLVLEVTCDGSGSARAETYTFTFGDGHVASNGSDPTAAHLYLDLDAAAGPVTLTVSDVLGRTDTDTWTP